MQSNAFDREFLLAFATRMQQLGAPPTGEEMAKLMGIPETRAYVRLLRLRQLDWLVAEPFKARAFQLTEIGRNVLDQLAGRTTPGEFILPRRCPNCGAKHFLDFGARCPACALGCKGNAR